MGLRRRKLPDKANDTNELEAEEIAGQGQWQRWAWGWRNPRSRPKTAMGLRPRKLPVKANDSNRLEAKEIAGQGQWQQWAWDQRNSQSRLMMTMSLRWKILPVKANVGDEPEIDKINDSGRQQQWAKSQQDWQSKSTSMTSPKLTKSAMDVNEGNVWIVKVSFVGENIFKRYYNYYLNELALGVLVVILSCERRAEKRGGNAHGMTLHHPY
jgi:hypothetical protein